MAAGLIVRAVRRAAARRATAYGDERRDDWRPFGETEFVAVEERPSPAEDTPLLVVPRFVDPRPAESEVLELPLLCRSTARRRWRGHAGASGRHARPGDLGRGDAGGSDFGRRHRRRGSRRAEPLFGTVTDGVVTLGTVTDGVETDGVETDGVETDGVETDGVPAHSHGDQRLAASAGLAQSWRNRRRG